MDEPRRAGLFLWHGSALVVGPGIDSTPHAHFALQMTLALERPFRARLSSDRPWAETEAAIFAPNQPHQLDCGGGLLAHLFVELPQRVAVATEVGARYRDAPGFAAVGAALDAARRGRLGVDDAVHAARQWLDCALPQARFPGKVDARIARALDWITTHPGSAPDGALLAAQAYLSESRFTHLFRQQTGLPLSRYLLWTRLLAAVAAVAGGENMTGAAHRAGFADLAHMSRTFRATFGVAPSELHKMTIAFKPAAG